MVHYRIQKCPLPVPILSQLDPVHTPTSHLLKIHLIIILPSTPGSPKWSLSLRFLHQNPVYAPPPYALHTPPTSFFSILSPEQYWVQIINISWCIVNRNTGQRKGNWENWTWMQVSVWCAYVDRTWICHWWLRAYVYGICNVQCYLGIPYEVKKGGIVWWQRPSVCDLVWTAEVFFFFEFLCKSVYKLFYTDFQMRVLLCVECMLKCNIKNI